MTIPAAFANKSPVRLEHSVIAVAERAVAESVAPSGQVCRDRSGSAIAAGDAVPVSPCVARRTAPRRPPCLTLQRTGSSFIPQHNDPTVGANNPAGVSFWRKFSLACEATVRIGRRRRRGRRAAGVVHLGLSSSAASKDVVLAPVSIGLTAAPIPPTD
ncbi:hypothetical protein [Brucella intermedia]|uniref:hypothetical protein n=1 Tax=Brucella intermedia TaxID=94625 RepID=UPI001269F8FB|nr:hypothetical protein [Brucella intermedia]WGG59423.1 hypothetical protein QA414_00365 [Brucella intermedia]